MPRLRRKRKGRDGLAPRTREHLLGGHDFAFLDGPECTETELMEAWQENGESLLEEWIEEHPGFRPWGFWRFDRPESRREGESEPAYLRRLGLLTEGEQLIERQLAEMLAAGRDDRSIAEETGLLAREVAAWRLAIEDGG